MVKRYNQDQLLPIPSFYNGGAINLEVDSYMSLLCWLQTSTNPKVVCSDLNGENATVLFSSKSNSEKIVGFAMDPTNHFLYVMAVVSYDRIIKGL